MLIAIGTAIAFVCGYIPFLHLPFGGTVTIASMLPVILISYMYGIKWGLFSGFVYSLLQIATSSHTVAAMFTPTDDSFMGIGIAFAIVLIDYILAYSSLGLGGMFANRIKNKTKALVLGTVVSMLICYLFHSVSGAIFYGAWAEWFFTDTVFANLAISSYIMKNAGGFGLAALYSLIYNGCYMIPEIIITAIVAVPVSRIPQTARKK